MLKSKSLYGNMAVQFLSVATGFANHLFSREAALPPTLGSFPLFLNLCHAAKGRGRPLHLIKSPVWKVPDQGRWLKINPSNGP